MYQNMTLILFTKLCETGSKQISRIFKSQNYRITLTKKQKSYLF